MSTDNYATKSQSYFPPTGTVCHEKGHDSHIRCSTEWHVSQLIKLTKQDNTPSSRR